MYRPPAFREDRLDVLHDAIRAHPLGTLVTCGISGLMANVVPFALRMNSAEGVLAAHLAKANEQVAHLRVGSPALAIFQGPQAYISPSWYATKRDHGKVVPTWNYVVVQVHGVPVVIDDVDWLRGQIEELTTIHESSRAEPWSIVDAPEDYIAGQLKSIIGIEIPISRVEGKWKASQNQPARNRIGVALGLREDGQVAMADEVAVRGGVR